MDANIGSCHLFGPGHPHPHLQTFVNNYAGLLQAMGRSREQILATLREMAPEFFRQG